MLCLLSEAKNDTSRKRQDKFAVLKELVRENLERFLTDFNIKFLKGLPCFTKVNFFWSSFKNSLRQKDMSAYLFLRPGF